MAVNTFAPERYTTGEITSKDGSTIGYRQIGQGPGMVLVQGAMGTADNFMSLAEALADTFTVYTPDRRGRGMSSAGSGSPGVQHEVDDLDALLTQTGAHFVFGLSSGALISLQAALTLPVIHKAAIFEPPLYVNGAPMSLLKRYQQEMAEGKLAAALITAMQATHLGPPIFNVIPRPVLEFMTNKMMQGEDKQAKPGDITMRALAPTLSYDFQVVAEMTGKLETFSAMRPEILLLGGSTSPAFLKADLDAMEKVLPHVSRIEFPGLGHAAAWNVEKQRNPHGDPQRVAQTLRQFFG